MSGVVSETWKYRIQKLNRLHTLVRREINNEFRLRCARRTCDNHLTRLKHTIYPILELEKRATDMAQEMTIIRQRYPYMETRWGYAKIQRDAAELHSRVRDVLEDDMDRSGPQPTSELAFLKAQNDLLLRRTNLARKIRKEGFYKRLERVFDLQPFIHRSRVKRTYSRLPDRLTQ